MTVRDLARSARRWAARQFAPPARSEPLDAFFRNVTGVIHVGANHGQERALYAALGLDVIWVEPIPSVFSELRRRLIRYPRQKAFKYLLTDVDGKDYNFNIANNDGQSSSIFNLSKHRDIYPDVNFVSSIKIKSSTLKSMISKENINISKYQVLVMDTQGSELLVLKGAGDLVSNFRYIKTEAPDFEAYDGCCMVEDLQDYLKKFGFVEIHRDTFSRHSDGGCYYDVTFERTAAA